MKEGSPPLFLSLSYTLYMFLSLSLNSSTMYHDAVSAYSLMKRYRSTEYAISNSGWTLLDAAEQIFMLSKQRVYNGQNGKGY